MYPEPKPSTLKITVEIRADQNGCETCSGTGIVGGGLAWPIPGFLPCPRCGWNRLEIAPAGTCCETLASMISKDDIQRYGPEGQKTCYMYGQSSFADDGDGYYDDMTATFQIAFCPFCGARL